MDLLAPIIRCAIAPAWAAWEGSSYLRHYRALRASQFNSVDGLHAQQIARLRELAHHAQATVPFWTARFAEAGLRAGQWEDLDVLRRLPLLTKRDLREQGGRLLSTSFPREALIKHTTSGSTGVSLVTYRDQACQQIKRAATLRADQWSGWRLGEPVACVWGNPQLRTDWRGRLRNALLDRHTLHLDTLRMNSSSMGAFVDAWLRRPPALLFGHAHSLYLLAGYVQERRPDARLRPRAIISTCMVLHDFERQAIEQVFQCPVTNRYGCEELSLIASQCERHQGLHVNAECLIVEILDQHGQPCPPGAPGRIVVTDLVNRAMPFFRYEVGDMASWASRPCGCGRVLPVLEKVEGRVADYVVTRAGEFISGISLTENFALQIPGVAQMQIVQEAVDHFVYNVVQGPEFGAASLRRIGELTAERFGEGVRFETNLVERIPQEPSGKYRFCVSKVEKRFD